MIQGRIIEFLKNLAIKGVVAKAWLIIAPRQINKFTSVFPYVCPVIDHEFGHNIFKVTVDPRGDSRVDPQLL